MSNNWIKRSEQTRRKAKVKPKSKAEVRQHQMHQHQTSVRRRVKQDKAKTKLSSFVRMDFTLLPPEMESTIAKHLEDNLFASLLGIVTLFVANTHIFEKFMIRGLRGYPSDILVAMVFLVHLMLFLRKDKAK